jgi:hypothetical protein
VKNFETIDTAKAIISEHASRTTDGEQRIIQRGSIPADPITPPNQTIAASGIAIDSDGQRAINKITKARA